MPSYTRKTLIIFDEIQECEEALNSLKYFCEDAPEYHIIAAGSLLGVAVKKRKMTVPVGKVRVMRMYPISFKEFLRASNPRTFEYIEEINAIEKLPEIILNTLKLEYRRYLVCGGMPDAVCAMLDNQGMEAVDAILQDILDLYELDFAKYAEPREIPRIHAIWHSLPSQLAKENRKFIYKVIKPVDTDGLEDADEDKALMNFEQDEEEALNLLIPKYVTSLIYGSMVEAVASENGARMQAMDSATSNAEEMIDKLSLQYNRARQGSITQELTEIIAGAEAIS